MVDILNIKGEPIFDDRIIKMETHTYNPYANTTFGHSDEIRIPIQQQDLYTLPCESFLYIEGRLTSKNANTSVLGMNCVGYMFDEIRYELNGVEVERSRNAGMTSMMKIYVSLSEINIRNLLYAGFSYGDRIEIFDGYFNFCVPLNVLLGFCEDYKRVIVNARQELILIRARNDNNRLVADPATEPKLELFKVQWRMPHDMLNEVNKLSMLRTLQSGRYLSMSFRSWDLYEYPLLPSTTKHSWAVKTATQLEKPRYVIFALQTNRKNIMRADKRYLDTNKITNVKLYLNSEFYPYDDLNLDFGKGKYALLYDMYTRFRPSYYRHDKYMEPLFDITTFRSYAIAVIDCSRQNESIKSATVDVRLEFELKENAPANTTAYCLIIHDRVVEYSPLTNVVRKIM